MCIEFGFNEMKTARHVTHMNKGAKTHHEVVLVLDVLLLACEHVAPQAVVLQHGACEAGGQVGNNVRRQVHRV